MSYQQRSKNTNVHITNAWYNSVDREGNKRENPYVESAALTDEEIKRLTPGCRIRLYPINYPRKGKDGKMIERGPNSPTHRLVAVKYSK